MATYTLVSLCVRCYSGHDRSSLICDIGVTRSVGHELQREGFEEHALDCVRPAAVGCYNTLVRWPRASSRKPSREGLRVPPEASPEAQPAVYMTIGC